VWPDDRAYQEKLKPQSVYSAKPFVGHTADFCGDDRGVKTTGTRGFSPAMRVLGNAVPPPQEDRNTAGHRRHPGTILDLGL
jgi:hypothetical protein